MSKKIPAAPDTRQRPEPPLGEYHAPRPPAWERDPARAGAVQRAARFKIAMDNAIEILTDNDTSTSDADLVIRQVNRAWDAAFGARGRDTLLMMALLDIIEHSGRLVAQRGRDPDAACADAAAWLRDHHPEALALDRTMLRNAVAAFADLKHGRRLKRYGAAVPLLRSVGLAAGQDGETLRTQHAKWKREQWGKP